MKKLLAMLLFIVLLTPSLSAYANIYGDNVSGNDLSDQRTFGSPNYDPSNTEGGLDGLWFPSFSIDWNISQNTDTLMWTYEYTLATYRTDISHFILELSDGATQNDFSDFYINGQSSGFGNNIEGPSLWGQHPSNPGYPTDDEIFGMKFDSGGDTASYQFTTSRSPVWGNFYAKGGKLQGGIFAHTYNNALANDEFSSDNELDFIVRPNGPPVAPEPVSYVLFSAGGAALGIRSYLKKKRN